MSLKTRFNVENLRDTYKKNMQTAINYRLAWEKNNKNKVNKLIEYTYNDFDNLIILSKTRNLSIADLLVEDYNIPYSVAIEITRYVNFLKRGWQKILIMLQ